MTTDYKFQGWMGLDPSAAKGNMKWQSYEPKTWDERDASAPNPSPASNPTAPNAPPASKTTANAPPTPTPSTPNTPMAPSPTAATQTTGAAPLTSSSRSLRGLNPRMRPPCFVAG
ncbi:MAG: hypothetical protein Q9174_007333 [Haloplaca sp. 1 TL-2023]